MTISAYDRILEELHNLGNRWDGIARNIELFYGQDEPAVNALRLCANELRQRVLAKRANHEPNQHQS